MMTVRFTYTDTENLQQELLARVRWYPGLFGFSQNEESTYQNFNVGILHNTASIEKLRDFLDAFSHGVLRLP